MSARVYCLALVFLCGSLSAHAETGSELGRVLSSQTKKKRKRRRGKGRKGRKARERRKAEEAKKKAEAKKAEEERIAEEKKKAEAKKKAEKRRKREGRKKSKVTQGTASRWSNRGAMEPVPSAVAVSAPLPKRNQPKPVGIATPGQRLDTNSDTLSARISISGYSVRTEGQQRIYRVNRNNNNQLELVQGDRDIQFMRARANLAYERIAGTELGVYVDLEYRPRINGTRFTDQRINELYVSYGLTHARRERELWWGVAAGRLAIREAGYAQTDGAAVRFKILDELRVGAFGGVSGNPYGYNWAQRSSEIFSANWINAGAFASLQMRQLSVNLAGVLGFANVDGNPKNRLAAQPNSGIDRVYVYLDAAYLITRQLNFIVNGRIDIISGGQAIQNLDGTLSYTPLPGLNLSLGGGRFTTATYDVSTGYTYEVAPEGNRTQTNPNARYVDEADNPIVPFDGALFTTVYNNVRLRAGYRIFRDLEVFTRQRIWLRDNSVNDALAQQGFGATHAVETFRYLPSGGARYRNPKIVDANFEAIGVLDNESQTNAILVGGVGRGLFGAYLGADIRYYIGDINGLDVGGTLSYTLPRDWLPGALSIRGQFRYYRENVVLEEPLNLQQGGPLGDQDVRAIIPVQESYMGFAGIEWRL